ncbi:MAG: hypothetical protein CMN10_14785 [Roseobacter sp.]|nr:hypothetical protein [Roseobacter sp.]MBV49821.1 hypothetical protein [Roseobacter sp.]
MLCVAGGETYYPLIETHFITTRMRREVLSALVVHLIRKEKRWAISGGVAALVGAACLIPLIAETLNPPLRAAPIHDISTDTVNPPAFEVLDETRAGTSHTRERGGPVLAEAQAPAYPDIVSLETDLSLDAAYQRALAVAEDIG